MKYFRIIGTILFAQKIHKKIMDELKNEKYCKLNDTSYKYFDNQSNKLSDSYKLAAKLKNEFKTTWKCFVASDYTKVICF